jgi:hypothetical protein
VSTTAAAPSLGEHSMKRCSGSQTTREASTFLGGEISFWYMASGFDAPWRRFFTTTCARCSLVTPEVMARGAAPAGEEGRRRGQAASSCQGSKNDERMMPLGIFSVPKTSTVSYCPARMAAGRQHERGAPAGTAGLDVDDGHARHAETAQHLVAGRHAAVGRAAERGLEPTLADCPPHGARPHRHHAHVGGRDAFEAAEGMHPDAGDDDALHDAGHAGAKA